MPKVFSLPFTESLAGHVAQAIARHAGPRPPMLIVESPAAAIALKSALADADWPGRSEGAPLPWCGSLDQAAERTVLELAVRSGRDDVSLPRATCSRRVELAQQLLDHRTLRKSIGSSARAALVLAGQWVELFEGWEWLQAAGRDPFEQANGISHLNADLKVLRDLHQANQSTDDRVRWILAHRNLAAADWIWPDQEVWFCTGSTPSPRDLSMAEVLFKAGDDRTVVFRFDPIDFSAIGASSHPGEPRALLTATTVEETAWAAMHTIVKWREQGIEDIGIVALDRKSVRRLRALLERAGEVLSDRSGWALDTTVAASAVVGLSSLLSSQASTQSLLEWIHSPFVTQGLQQSRGFNAEQRRRLDAVLRDYGRVAAIDVSDLIRRGLLALPESIFVAAGREGRRPLNQWVEQLLSAAAACGLDQSLATDPAGAAVIAALQTLHAESAGDPIGISSALWSAVLAEELNAARFVDATAGAAVRVVSLGALLWQQPQAVLVVGADAARLPSRAIPRFFEPSRLAEMGLALDPALSEAERFTQFAALWQLKLPITLIATSEQPDSEAEFSPWIELLSDQPAVKAAAFIPQYPLNMSSIPAIADQFEPQVGMHWPYGLPQEISVSQAQRLLDCPYQFVLSSLMGLSDAAELEDDASASDLGSLIHHVLSTATHSFESHAQCMDWLIAQIDRALNNSTQWAWQSISLGLGLPSDVRVQLRAEALALVPPLSRWLMEQQSRGRAEVRTELSVQRTLADPPITIKGRIDRLDVAQGVLIDFKTSDPSSLKKRIRPEGGDVQLPLYAWLTEQPDSTSAGQGDGPALAPMMDARFVAIRREGVVTLGLQADGLPLAERAYDAIENVRSVLKTISSGGDVLALGPSREARVCQYCPVKGVCRRDDYAVVVGHVGDEVDAFSASDAVDHREGQSDGA